jgi:hypothetical protein
MADNMTAPETSQTDADVATKDATTDELPYNKEFWKGAVAAAEANRREYFDGAWKESVNYRVMQPFGGPGRSELGQQDRIAVPEDWSRTKQKTAQLMFQLPKIVAKEKAPEYAVSAPIITAAVNDKLRREVQAHYMIDECLADVINAAGIMVSVIGVDIREETRELPAPPPEIDPITGLTGPQLPPQIVKQVVSRRFYWDRTSPGSFLWPAEFNASNWDKAPWLGYDSYLSTSEVKRRWKDKLPEGYKCNPSKPLLLSEDITGEYTKKDSTSYVKVTTIWYRAAVYDESVAHPDKLRKIVFVDGHDEPVEHEDSDWQRWIDEVPPMPEVPGEVGPDGQPQGGQPAQPGRAGHFLGLSKFPIRVATLTYVSDLAVPPSDSQASRPQVREMIRSRSQMIRMRDTSIPIRWYDTNRLDEAIADRMRAGEWNDMVPTNGPGDRVIGEVARANYPRENFQFQSIIGADLDRSWALSNNALSVPNETVRTASEVNQMGRAGDIRLDYEKERVNRYIVEGAEVLFSLMQMFAQDTDYATIVGEDGKDRLTPFTRAEIAGDYAFDFVTDSSDRMTTEAKQQSALKMYNLLGNSPTTNRAALEAELWILHGFDPAKLTVKPQEPAPEKPNISFRFGGEDMLNPMAIALLQKAGYDISPTEIKAAAMMIQDAVLQMQQARTPFTATAGLPGGPIVPPGEAVPQQTQVEPTSGPEPILKRATDGSRLT